MAGTSESEGNRVGGKAADDGGSNHRLLEQQVQILQNNVQTMADCFGVLVNSTANLAVEVQRLAKSPGAAAQNPPATSSSEAQAKSEAQSETSSTAAASTTAGASASGGENCVETLSRTLDSTMAEVSYIVCVAAFSSARPLILLLYLSALLLC